MPKYGTIASDQQPVAVALPSHRRVFERRSAVVILVLTCTVLVFVSAFVFNPQAPSVRSKLKNQISLLHQAFVALTKLWSNHGSGIRAPPYEVPTDVGMLLGMSCCNPNICSKYALDACSRMKRQRRIDASRVASKSQNSDGFLESAAYSLSSPQMDPVSDDGDQTSVATAHRGAAAAAAALGLHLV
eukprot:CAMPEP_0113668160 /NCGR_PEP_ID=MMETSP0038_2-20120614/3845_1 /TAXON_ID=2898 /ORGANISM="Cryptomonas paramecium" /LENGTH=186 /DNA_ID=CAMNT_0000583871 /DNA_START=13 /DNA_END=569 /DNA_ORIENTATION=+ /assembly_acc=CAM_ASM_000170